MTYIVIETFDDTMWHLETDQDEHTLFFENYEDALQYEEQNCHDGIIFDIDYYRSLSNETR